MGKSLLNRFKPAGGGGFLNNVDGAITSLRFTNEFPGQEGKETKGTPLYAVLGVRQDGAENDVQTTLFVGNGENIVITEDNMGLQSAEQLSGALAFGRFYNSVEAHAGETDLRIVDTDPSIIDFSHLVGLRVRFTQVVNEWKMEQNAKAFASNKKIGTKRAKDLFNEKGQRRGKSADGKAPQYYDERDLEVNAVYGYVEVAEAPVAKATTKAAPKAAAPKAVAAAPKAAPKAAAPVATTSDVADLSLEALLFAIGRSKTKTVNKEKLNLAVTQFFMQPDHKDQVDERENVRKFVLSDDNLDTLVEAGAINYDKSTGDITAA